LMEPVGVGALQLAFEQQVKRFAAEGLFDETRKKPLPLFPRCIGIVTSPVGAVLRDMLHILERRNAGIDLMITPVRVQGSTAAREIADAIRLFNSYGKKQGKKIDVIIVGRGGGSIEDLWAFNEEAVIRAIYDSEIPIISAVGHETDFTIADFVADLRAPTPSAAAEMVAPEAGELKARLDALQLSLEREMKYYLLARRGRLRDLIESRGFMDSARAILSLSHRRRNLEVRAAHGLLENLRKTRARLSEAQLRLTGTDFRAPLILKSAKLESLEQKMGRAMQRLIENKQHGLAVRVGKLDMLSPLAVLGRGYVLVKDVNDHLISRAAFVQSGQDLTLRFEDGEVACQAK
jgi:exodeoxyribonuclease VII large subunit